MNLPRWLLYGFVIAVVTAWFTVIVAQVINPAFQAPESVNAIMTALSGAVVTQILVSSKKKDPPDDKKNDTNSTEGDPK